MGDTNWRRAVSVIVVLAAAAAAEAQTTEPHRYLAVKAGSSIEHAEDNFGGASAATGIALGGSIGPSWSAEIEVWWPRFMRSGALPDDRRHRDLLANGALVRWIGHQRVRPFLLFGFAVGYTQDRSTRCAALRPSFRNGEIVATAVPCDAPDVIDRREQRYGGLSLFALAGGGAAIRVTPRLSLVPEVRADLFPTSMIVRPSVGVQIGF